jgi:hypothetical protein
VSTAIDAAMNVAITVAIRELAERRAIHGLDPLEHILLTALVDARVQDAIAAHLARGEVYIGAGPLSKFSNAETVAIVLEFRRLPPGISLLPALLAVRVSLTTGEVELIVDPYRGGALEGAARAGGSFFPRGSPGFPVPPSVSGT